MSICASMETGKEVIRTANIAVVEDHTDEVISAKDAAVARALEMIGGQIDMMTNKDLFL